MARKGATPALQRANVSDIALPNALRRARRLYEELDAWETKPIYDDPIVTVLETKYSTFLSDIFEPGTAQYNAYNIDSLYGGSYYMGMEEAAPGEIIKGYERGKAGAMAKLQAMIDNFEDRIEHSVEAPAGGTYAARAEPPIGKNVFIVHGHDEAAKHEVARFVASLDLNPIILAEQADEGRTIIEKFEAHAAGVDFAIVLVTPDDEGRVKAADPEEDPPLKARARQNVILELGFFAGVLGRNRVVALMKGDIEIPSDFSGVLYTVFDERGAWKLAVAGEMKAAGIDVDMNKVVP